MRERIYEELKGLEQKGLFREWKIKLGKKGVACKGGVVTLSRLKEAVTREDIDMMRNEMTVAAARCGVRIVRFDFVGEMTPVGGWYGQRFRLVWARSLL